MRQICIMGAGVLLVATLVFGLFNRSQRGHSGSLLKTVLRAEAAFAAGNVRSAQQLAENALSLDPQNIRARMIVARCLDAGNDPQRAFQLLLEVADKDSTESVDAACLAGDIAFYRLCQPGLAESVYQQALNHDPSSIQANDRLAILMGVTGQWWQHIPVRLITLRHNRFTSMDLLVLALGQKALLNPELAEQMEKVSPDDPLVLLASARLAVEKERHEKAIQLLNRAVLIDDQLLQAQVLLGTEYFHLNDVVRFVDWLKKLPANSDQHPGIWILRGK